MSYVDAIYNKEKDRVYVVERVKGQRVYRDYAPEHTFYYDDPKGKYRTIYNTPVSKFSTNNKKEFRRELAIQSNKRLWESDFKPVNRCLEANYLGAEPPKLNTAFFDIETDFDKERGFAPIEDPFNKITAISVYLDWLDKLVTLAVPPKTLTVEQAQEIVKNFEDTFIFETEAEMLEVFLDLIDDADILSGWNSEGYDIPYTVGRVIRVLSKDDTRRFCLWDQYPKRKDYERFGASTFTFDIVGRQHLDYMQLYRKYTYEERHSYSLDAIGEHELGERKTAYEGTLDQLYNNDFYTFIEYNRQDTRLLARLDVKLKFIDLANTIAHDNTVLLPTTMGAVATTEQAIINEAHSKGLVVQDKKRKPFVQEGDEDDTVEADEESFDDKAAGAYVAFPRKGMHEYIGAIDINSLYPSAIRALNMGPETIVGQLRPDATEALLRKRIAEGHRVSFAQAWEGLFSTLEYESVMNQEVGTAITIDWEIDGREAGSDVVSAKEIYKLIFDSNKDWTLSANGTIFTNERKGIVPGLLERWYAERKQMQKKLKEVQALNDAEQVEYWDKRQLVKKINLNSLYGAILNPHCRFYDHRIGQSTTLCGRSIAKHMDAYVNEAITGKYDHVGDAVIYGDTDSVYFSAWPIIKADVEAGKMEWNRDICVQVYDSIADGVNESFPAFMQRAFHCPLQQGAIIKGGREIVASKGIFITKKRYAVMIYDKEGTRVDVKGKPGKVKAMGLDLKRADTPKKVQVFLSEILEEVLDGAQREHVIERVRTFKEEFAALQPWEKGTPKRVNNLTKFTNLHRIYHDTSDTKTDGNKKPIIPGHVTAAINWNNLCRMNGDNYSMKIVDGMKTIVCKLKSNPLGFTSVGYPIDQLQIPQWFKDLPFDDDLMEMTIIDKKVENLFGVLKWDIAINTDINSTFDQLFEF